MGGGVTKAWVIETTVVCAIRSLNFWRLSAPVLKALMRKSSISMGHRILLRLRINAFSMVSLAPFVCCT